jgi:FkbM family methyltransferase
VKSHARSSRLWSFVWDRLLLAYGQWLPYHPKKWRVVDALMPRAAPTWTTPRLAKRRGIWFELDLRQFGDRFIYYLEYERWETRFVERCVRPGWVVIDVGAHIGYYTLLFARRVGERGCVLAVEPALATFASLRRNIELNPAVNVRACRMALSDRQGVARLRFGKHSGLTHLATHDDPGDETTPMSTLDDFVKEQGLTRLDFLKVDIEGAEGRLLAGAVDTLRRLRPIVMIEVNPAALAMLGERAEDLVRRLEALGYSLHTPTWRGLRPLRALPGPGQFVNAVGFPRAG